MYIPEERKKENLAEGPERQRGCKSPAAKKSNELMKIYIKCWSTKRWVFLIPQYVPFKDESKREKEYGCYCLSIEHKDEIVDAMIKCSFWE